MPTLSFYGDVPITGSDAHGRASIGDTAFVPLSASARTVIYPDPPRGGYNPNPQFSCDTPPQPSEVQRGVYVIVMEGVINVVKY